MNIQYTLNFITKAQKCKCTIDTVHSVPFCAPFIPTWWMVLITVWTLLSIKKETKKKRKKHLKVQKMLNYEMFRFVGLIVFYYSFHYIRPPKIYFYAILIIILYIHGYLIFCTSNRYYKWGNFDLFSKWFWISWRSMYIKTYFILYMKINSKWINI